MTYNRTDNTTHNTSYNTTHNTTYNTTINTTQSYLYYRGAQVAILLWKVCSPILLLLGTFGNILSVIVLSRRTIRKSGASRYFICLAVADILVLFVGLIPNWMEYAFGVILEDKFSGICKVGTWLLYFSLDLSAWILVSVTIERAISVWRPLEVKSIITRKVFVLNILIIVLILLLVNGHYLFGLDILQDTLEPECGGISDSYDNFLDVFTWIDLVLFCLGPFVCQLIGNIAIIIGIIRASRNMDVYSLETTGQRRKRQTDMKSMTALLLCVNAIYILCTLPVSAFLLYKATSTKQYGDLTVEEKARDLLIYTCVNLVMYVNNSTNFITYMASGRRFREELYQLFCGSKKNINRAGTSDTYLSSSRTKSTSFNS